MKILLTLAIILGLMVIFITIVAISVLFSPSSFYSCRNCKKKKHVIFTEFVYRIRTFESTGNIIYGATCKKCYKKLKKQEE